MPSLLNYNAVLTIPGERWVLRLTKYSPLHVGLTIHFLFSIPFGAAASFELFTPSDVYLESKYLAGEVRLRPLNPSKPFVTLSSDLSNPPPPP